MKNSIKAKLEQILERHQEIEHLLNDSSIIANQDKFRALSKEYSELEQIVTVYKQYKDAKAQLQSVAELLQDDCQEMRELAALEQAEAEAALTEHEQDLMVLLLPKDPDDNKSVFLEIRAGTGGDEAAIFAGDLFRMYLRYSESKRWQAEVLSASEGDHGGFKEVIVKVNGEGAYGELKFESGAHRVQRVPATESQGRVHTSACTVAVMPEPSPLEEVQINTADLKIDTYRSSGAGGQHVNTTDSAIRITHIPSGLVVECQDERSQHKNKARALSLLQARLKAQEKEKHAKEIAQTRKSLVGSGDRSERIRTYNFPQGRLTDHRINLTLYKLDAIMSGDLAEVIHSLLQEHQASELTNLSTD